MRYDLLLSTPIPGKTGFSSTYSNTGEMSNKGVEFQITTKNIQKKDFNWETSFNIAHNANLIERLPVSFSQYDRDWVRLEEGKPMYSFWLYKQLYVDPQTGFISSKSKDGRPLQALELPGLWNGAMSDWNTLMVEVPASTFNPVKTVNDLLRPSHQ